MNRFPFRQFGIGVLSGFVAGCQPNQMNSTEPQDSKVYAAFFAESARPRPETLYVAESTLVFDALGKHEPDPAHSRLLSRLKSEGVSTELASSLSRASAQKRLTHALRLGAPTHVLSDVELNTIPAGDPREYWNRFYRRYPRAKGYQAFSPIGYSTDGAEALFYHEYYCGGLCGAGTLVWVARDQNGQWKVRTTINLWIA